MKYLIIAVLATTVATAGEHKPPPKPVTQTQQQSQHESQSQHQSQEAEASAKATSASTSTASANGGEGGAGGTASSTATGGSSDSQATGGTSQAGATLVNTYPQQVPALGQGSFAISGCQAAGNAGGANSHGAAFLGFGFTTDECYRLMLAQAYQAVGQTEAACEVLNRTDMALNLERKRGFTVPSCKPREVAQPLVVAPAPAPDTVTHQELKEVEQRITEKVIQK